ncbi:MAG: hypothetical protein K6E53_09770 [Lachnospiraceae bacterium]|nr:hypothetical protein [Lachnospiraceae bacterium]
MDDLINKIKDTVLSLLQYDLQRYFILAQEMADIMVVMFPAIIDSYNYPGMEEHRSDASYWSDQLQRIMDALENGDSFEVIDVLYNETRPNLIELKGILEEKGLL